MAKNTEDKYSNDDQNNVYRQPKSDKYLHDANISNQSMKGNINLSNQKISRTSTANSTAKLSSINRSSTFKDVNKSRDKKVKLKEKTDKE